jgi:hypothetical protein
MKQEEITVETQINKNIESLFDLSQDLKERTKWDYHTQKIEFMGTNNILKKGAMVSTLSKEGIYMETKYIIYKRPFIIAVKMMNKSSVFNSFMGTWNYIPINERSTVLKITYKFNLNFKYLFISKLVKNKIQKNICCKLKDLKTYAEIHSK